ncbi:hypothetical protein [Austwickia chelonae]|uniref:ATP/GTP-binding protein n=1 Tax=Austwickia chelonae NBRC 105200 TaxID=1184607 RepID=K6V3M7_9MICO|nr:hypothetical protein [Austwickia chelonae]GAB76688.1 hypothetical protein AUCHE_02_00490 [Austwickia chelonae NBRC 105200]
MPRANRRRRDERELDLGRALGGLERRENHPDGDWFVRRVAGRDPGRRYLCPGCQQTLAGDIAHVVVWPADGLGGLDDRRHWHSRCWQNRSRRPPRGSWR